MQGRSYGDRTDSDVRMDMAGLKDRIGDLRTFVSQYVQLDDAGRGPCPFHPPDKNPSFAVHPDGFWVCFHEVNPSTGKQLGGDAIDFYRRLKGLSYRDAIKDLAAMVAAPVDGSAHEKD